MRLQDITASEVIGYADDNGRISEVEVRQEDSTWILLHTHDATFRMSTAEDESLYEIDGLEVYEPSSQTLWDWPTGIESVSISRGFHCHNATVRGTRRALRSYLYENWYAGGDDESFDYDLARMTKVEA